MAYKIQAGASVRDEILRCAREQLDRAVAELTDGVKEDPAKAIHNARKAIKKERSLLRLARGAMPARERRAENEALRAAGRRLSGTRDAEVTIASVDELAERFAGRLPASTFAGIREQLEARGAPTDGAAAGVLPDAVEELRAIRQRAADWELTAADGWSAIEAGLLRSYKRGRAAYGRAKDTGSTEDLHAWRKRVKDLWYQERLLAPTCGPVVRGQAKEAHRVADLLGDDHDLAVLRQELTERAMPVPVDVDSVVALLDHRRGELQTEALHLGARLYAESTKAFMRRMRRLWSVGRALAEEPLEHSPGEIAAATREPTPS